MAKSDKTSEKLSVGAKSCGWTLVKEFKRFNLWEYRYQKDQVLRECFWKDEKPIERAFDYQ